ncbi:glutamine--fructose-6-phosphate transaminase (isomerizing) [Methanobrevibacter sp. DSM 116169]|uniref:glutamine--fructose-6-phosphate transaminase (isomerizing) n=1 Tax=Methanobrevibacter sp. DSM 116169 TaxID=3242727 RepID=UPI0038FCFE86
MCGIVGCILKNNKKAVPILFESISRLQYRGYDSIGIATLDEKINIKKDKGKVEETYDISDFHDMGGSCGIAHIRWATHGFPSKINAHPHCDEKENIAIVHNGIIENYLLIKEFLENKGYIFKSDTDSEVIAHLIEYYMNNKLDFESAFNETINDLDGSYTIVAISKKEQNKIIASCKDSPLILGIGRDGYYLASDSLAVLEYTNKIIYFENDETVIVTSADFIIKNKDGDFVDKEIKTINLSSEIAKKDGYDYFMLKEINEQADVVRNTLNEMDNIKKIVNDVKDNINRIYFVSCGTSYHASLIGKYLIESLSNIPTQSILASEFKYCVNTLDENTLVIGISQSGETRDTINAIKLAKSFSKTISIVNAPESLLSRNSDYIIYTQAEPEIAVAATKTYLSQLTCIYILAAYISKNNKLLSEISEVPNYIEEVLKNTLKIKEMSTKYKYADNLFFIGRGYAYPIALEGALKLKEITYIHAEGYAAGELKHGPLALIDHKFPVIAIVPPGEEHEKTMININEIKSRGGDIISLGSTEDNDLEIESTDYYGINPNVSEILSPLVYIIPLQILSYFIAIERGEDPDKPRNLSKTVTVD